MLPPPERKERQSNIELYRILVMLLIVSHHYVVNSGVLNETANIPLSWRTILLYIIGMWGKTGINCFVLITGYFMCKSEITIKKFLKLLLEVVFYNIVLNLIFAISGYTNFSPFSFVFAMLPIQSVEDNFIGCYLLFFLFIPFINILIKNMTKQQHIILIALTTFVYTILGSSFFINVRLNYITWFCILYFIASYIRLYDFPHKNQSRPWLFALCLIIPIAIASVIGITLLQQHTGKTLNFSNACFFVSDSNKIFAVIISICSFMFFRNLKIRQSKIINTIAASVFGVLLIHANSDIMRQWLWKDICNVSGNFHSPYFVLHALTIPSLIFLCCIAIDYIRIHTIETPAINICLKAITSPKNFFLK